MKREILVPTSQFDEPPIEWSFAIDGYVKKYIIIYSDELDYMSDEELLELYYDTNGEGIFLKSVK